MAFVTTSLVNGRFYIPNTLKAKYFRINEYGCVILYDENMEFIRGWDCSEHKILETEEYFEKFHKLIKVN